MNNLLDRLFSRKASRAEAQKALEMLEQIDHKLDILLSRQGGRRRDDRPREDGRRQGGKAGNNIRHAKARHINKDGCRDKCERNLEQYYTSKYDR